MSEAPIDYRCKVCRKECDSAPADGSGAICPEHCEDHDYIYNRGDGHYCRHCGDPPPRDWFHD